MEILDSKDFIIDDEFKEYIIQLEIKYCGYGENGGRQIAEGPFNYLKTNKQKINHFRGELEYIIKQIGFADKRIVDGMIDYIKKLGYDGIKYESDKNYEGEGSWNYIIFNKNILTSL